MVQVQQLGTGTRYKVEILHHCGKRVRTKSQKVLGTNSYICRSYRGKTGRGPFYPPPPILNRVKNMFKVTFVTKTNSNMQNSMVVSISSFLD